jgi:hypothetical protein
MQKNKRTRKNRKASKKYTYNNKLHKYRSRKHRRYRGGMVSSDNAEIKDLQNIISKYIEKAPKESIKYGLLKSDIDTYTNTVANKNIEDLTDKDLGLIQRIAIQIIDDNYSLNWFKIKWGNKLLAQMQKIINKVVLYFINDIELNNTTEIILQKRITNNTPYLKVINNRDKYETTYDVNEMFALIKSEMNKNEYPVNLKKSFLKKLTLNSKFGLEPIPPLPSDIPNAQEANKTA